MSNQNGSNGSAPAELARVLTLRSLVFYGIAFIIPLAFFTTYGIVTNTTHGHVSMTYVVATLCMVFTAYSYCRMSKASISLDLYMHMQQKHLIRILGLLRDGQSCWDICSCQC